MGFLGCKFRKSSNYNLTPFCQKLKRWFYGR
jgi:hypothetical protein